MALPGVGGRVLPQSRGLGKPVAIVSLSFPTCKRRESNQSDVLGDTQITQLSLQHMVRCVPALGLDVLSW